MSEIERLLTCTCEHAHIFQPMLHVPSGSLARLLGSSLRTQFTAHKLQFAVCIRYYYHYWVKLESASPAADYKFPFSDSNAASGISKHAPKLMGRPFWRHAAVAALIFTSDQALHGKGVIVLPCQSAFFACLIVYGGVYWDRAWWTHVRCSIKSCNHCTLKLLEYENLRANCQ